MKEKTAESIIRDKLKAVQFPHHLEAWKMLEKKQATANWAEKKPVGNPYWKVFKSHISFFTLLTFSTALVFLALTKASLPLSFKTSSATTEPIQEGAEQLILGAFDRDATTEKTPKDFASPLLKTSNKRKEITSLNAVVRNKIPEAAKVIEPLFVGALPPNVIDQRNSQSIVNQMVGRVPYSRSEGLANLSPLHLLDIPMLDTVQAFFNDTFPFEDWLFDIDRLKDNSIGIQLMGGGGLVSIMYEKTWANRWPTRIGIGYYEENGNYIALPIGVSYLFSLKNRSNKIASSLDYAFLNPLSQNSNPEERDRVLPQHAVYFNLGFQHNGKEQITWKVNAGPMFHFTAIEGKRLIRPWVGVTIGRQF